MTPNSTTYEWTWLTPSNQYITSPPSHTPPPTLLSHQPQDPSYPFNIFARKLACQQPEVRSYPVLSDWPPTVPDCYWTWHNSLFFCFFLNKKYQYLASQNSQPTLLKKSPKCTFLVQFCPVLALFDTCAQLPLVMWQVCVHCLTTEWLPLIGQTSIWNFEVQ